MHYVYLLAISLLSFTITTSPSVRTLLGNHDNYLGADEECKTNFECDTSCCENNKCADIQNCKNRVTYIYISVGVIAGVFLCAIVIFFVCSVNQTRKNVSKIRQENLKKAEDFKNQAENNRKKAEEAQNKISDKRY